MSGKRHFPEMTGQGVALLDYDRDGDMDVYCVQGALLAGGTMSEATFPFPEGRPLSDRLFQNRLAEEGRLRFVDVTEAVGLAAEGYGIGAAVGDVDDNGWPDLYLTSFGANQLWLNTEGRFTDATAAVGAGDLSWSSGASFIDLDGDGDLDLYVVNYVDYDIGRNPSCFAGSSRLDYCGPSSFAPLADTILRNRGDGSFERWAPADLRTALLGPGLGSVTLDADGDGRLDLYVANDGAENRLFLNRAGTLVEEGLFAGVAVNREGAAEAGMGVDAGDVDGDGDEDLIVAHLAGETNTLYRNLGDALFEDATVTSGLGASSLRWTAFGASFVDVDNDGWLDVAVANGAVRILEQQVPDPFPLKQPNQLFRNLGGRFAEVSESMPEEFVAPQVSRGLVVGDVDDDGRADLVVANNQGPLQLFLNRTKTKNRWLGVRLIRPSGSPAVGAFVRARLSDGRTLVRRVRTDGSYASARDPRILLGLGTASIASIEVEWPDGSTTTESPAGLLTYVEWAMPPTGE